MITLPPIHAREVNQKEFAALIGKSEPLISRWKGQGRLVMTEDGQRVRVAETVAKLNATIDPARGGDRTVRAAAPAPLATSTAGAGATTPAAPSIPDDPDDLNYQREAARDKRASARQRELELAERAGALVAAQAVEHRIAGLVRAAVDQLASSRRRLAPTLAIESDARKVEQILAERDREFCTKVAALVSRETPPAEAAT